MAHILYLTATGAADPTRASLPFHLAVNGSAEAGDTAELVLAGDATELVKAGASFPWHHCTMRVHRVRALIHEQDGHARRPQGLAGMAAPKWCVVP